MCDFVCSPLECALDALANLLISQGSSLNQTTRQPELSRLRQGAAGYHQPVYKPRRCERSLGSSQKTDLAQAARSRAPKDTHSAGGTLTPSLTCSLCSTRVAVTSEITISRAREEIGRQNVHYNPVPNTRRKDIQRQKQTD